MGQRPALGGGEERLRPGRARHVQRQHPGGRREAPDDQRRRLPEGLGAHAPSEVVLYLGGRCTAFTADVGVDDEREATNKQGSATFEVYADGARVAATGVRTWQDPAVPLTAGLGGAQYLRLVVTDGGYGNSYDRGDWAAARLTCA
ncbi:NPCBM/NEW2 domain-containing protein [Amycolatopsis mongoliensis]|uniref:NPCBM/NEW2 domain-containing protein n=1 Tax=Amycolatopsis mongoliensis TaxID=715475 RepID=A0A9Y2K199_9PSEU|nr:NPCBM/NEW2 domain-containing protein [Amycolatopsis sp. 4-36]WIY07282.1 NPCBM/NEW2 domain-containing protein [Amycolatopsis sp. 4-36]